MAKETREHLRPFGKKGETGADIAVLRGTKGREDLSRLRVGDYRVIYAVVA